MLRCFWNARDNPRALYMLGKCPPLIHIPQPSKGLLNSSLEAAIETASKWIDEWLTDISLHCKEQHVCALSYSIIIQGTLESGLQHLQTRLPFYGSQSHFSAPGNSGFPSETLQILNSKRSVAVCKVTIQELCKMRKQACTRMDFLEHQQQINQWKISTSMIWHQGGLVTGSTWPKWFTGKEAIGKEGWAGEEMGLLWNGFRMR